MIRMTVRTGARAAYYMIGRIAAGSGLQAAVRELVRMTRVTGICMRRTDYRRSIARRIMTASRYTTRGRCYTIMWRQVIMAREVRVIIKRGAMTVGTGCSSACIYRCT